MRVVNSAVVNSAGPDKSRTPPPMTAVMITTFDTETLAVAEHFREAPEQRRHHEERGTLYEIGSYSGRHRWTVAVAEVGPGNTTAGIELERANAAFNPAVVMLVGVAGGLKDLRRGDVVAAEAVYDYESGKDVHRRLLPRIKTHSSSHRLVQHARLVARHGTWPDGIRSADAPTRPRAVVKPIAAGGKLVADDRSQTAELLRQYCSDAVAVEMEGYGFLRGAYLNGGLEVLVVRGVSDLLSGKDEHNDTIWQPIAARNAAAFAFAVLDSLGYTAATDQKRMDRKHADQKHTDQKHTDQKHTDRKQTDQQQTGPMTQHSRVDIRAAGDVNISGSVTGGNSNGH